MKSSNLKRVGFSLTLIILYLSPSSSQNGCESPILEGSALAIYKSSSFSGNNEPSHFPIGHQENGWCPYALDEHRWIEVDLGAQYVLKRIDVKYYKHLMGLLPLKEFVLSWSETGEDGKWNTFETPFRVSTSLSDDLSRHNLSNYGDIPMTAQNIRIKVTDPHAGMFCVSIEFYGCTAFCSKNLCPSGHHCTKNELGQERCEQCLPGFVKKRSNCIARSPCDASPCHGPKAECISHVPYNYACICKRNFMGDSQTCTSCDPGYIDKGHGCSDINECETAKHNCNDKQDCVNTDGSYICQCKLGFTKNIKGDGCTDIDECKGKDVCSSDKKNCVNKEGHFICKCIHKGYILHGEKCLDIDECKAGLHKCKNAKCDNTDGGYRCRCKAGYKFKKHDVEERECIDRNECKDAGKPCSENAFCRNLQGGYRCTCKPGFAGDGRQCLQGLASTQKQQANKIAIIAGFGSVGLLSIIAITAVLAWICHKKTKKTEHETLMLTSFEPGFDVGYAEDIPEEHWQEYNNYESDYETADESDDSDVSLW